MNVEQTKRTLMGIPPRKSVLIESDRGLGKSEVVAQTTQALSEKLGVPFNLIDFRLAQCEVADVIGMMRHVDTGEIIRTVYKDGKKESEIKTLKNVTVHDFAEWFPQDSDSHGFLFLDELFRAPRDLQNAVMELALDYRYHFKELPIGWRVIAASNDNMDIYSGSFPDPALYDRFLKIKFKPTVPEWLAYARSIRVHRAVTQYISKFTADLMPENIEVGKISPSPRSWVSLSDCIKYMTENGDEVLKDLDYFLLLAKGYLGDTVSLNFIEYIRKNYKIFTGEDILNKWEEKDLEREFSVMTVPELGFYHEEIIKYILEKEKLTKRQSNNLFSFVKAIPKESAGGFWEQFCNKCRNAASTWYNSNEDIKDYIYSFLCKETALKEL